MPRPLPRSAFEMPLTPNEAANLGLFAAYWGQIDHYMCVCISQMLKMPVGAALVLMEGMTSGPRLNMFNRLAKKHISDKVVAKAVTDFNKDTGRLIEKRNHLMHGLWGYWKPDDGKPLSENLVAVYYAKSPEQTVFASDLIAIADEAAAQSVRIYAISEFLRGMPWNPKPRKMNFIWGKYPPPELPEGFPKRRV